MNLSIAPERKKLTITEIDQDEKSLHRLETLGVTLGATVVVLSRETGSVILIAHGSRIALDKKTAASIQAEKKEEEECLKKEG